MFTQQDRIIVYGTVAAGILGMLALAGYAGYLEYIHPQPYPIARTFSLNSGDTVALTCAGPLNIERRRDQSVFIKCETENPNGRFMVMRHD